MTPDRPALIYRHTISWLHRVEDAVLVTLVLVMIVVAVAQIVLRNLFDSGLMWGDPLVRVLVLWVGLLGAMTASRADNHIRIDVITRYLPVLARRFTGIVIKLLTAVVCGSMAWISTKFIILEMEFPAKAFGSIPVWVCELVIPFVFFIISVRYLLMTLQDIRDWRPSGS
ncbi:MAG: TRAP transporter small permease [Desulfobacteraceae bacterium]|nr:MAG: TRAP transporter small permease [Desulfobacteraceae bacterium]